MTDDCNDVHALVGWRAIFNRLLTADAPPPSMNQPARPATFDLNKLAICPIERLTPRTATVDWNEFGVCHYGEQTWIQAAAPHNGTCVFSGVPIQRGDPIYRPRSTKPPPANAHAMIDAGSIMSLPCAWRA